MTFPLLDFTFKFVAVMDSRVVNNDDGSTLARLTERKIVNGPDYKVRLYAFGACISIQLIMAAHQSKHVQPGAFLGGYAQRVFFILPAVRNAGRFVKTAFIGIINGQKRRFFQLDQRFEFFQLPLVYDRVGIPFQPFTNTTIRIA